jgi:hypothetical protein
MSMAEAKFAAAQKKSKQALSDREKERQQEAKHTAKLRGLRLARDAAVKQAAEEEAAAKLAAKPKPKKQPTPTPKRPPRIY